MLEVSIHKNADRRAIIQKLKRFGEVTERQMVQHVIGVKTDHNDPKKMQSDIAQIKRISGVIDAEDGEEITQGFAQTHTLSKGVYPNLGDAAAPFTLMCLDFDPWRIQHDLLYADYEIVIADTNDGSGVVIGIADNLMSNSGHTEFAGRFSGTPIYNGYPGDAIHPHGNWCASCAAGASFGVAPGATLINTRGLNAANAGATTILVNAMDAIGAAHDAGSAQHICNCSFGGSSTSYDTVALDLADSGCPVIAAVGNSSLDLSINTIKPAESQYVVSVGGLTPNKFVDRRSNYGSEVDVWTGYGPHWALNATGSFEEVSGTSFAAPMVCGVAARMLQGRPKMTTLAETVAFNAELISMTKQDCANRLNQKDTSIRRINYPLPPAQFTITRTPI